MADHWICAKQLFDGMQLRQGLAVGVKAGRVTEIVAANSLPDGAAKTRLDGILSPGFFDIQVNGGGGVMVNNDPTPDTVQRIVAAHRAGGTAHLLPTCITDRPEVLRSAAEAVIACRGHPGVAGMHIEGPHIAVNRKGTHDPRYIRPFDAETRDVVALLRDAGVPVLITVAPESVTPGDVQNLCAMGAVVSLGHSDTTAPVAEEYFAAGATGVTHLFNAMSQMQGRAPGLTGAAISSDAFCGIIADGHHVSPQMIAIAARARPTPRRMIAVTDAMATVGGPPEFTLYGQRIGLRDGCLRNADGALAGAHTTLIDSLRFLVTKAGIALEDALAMMTSTPAQFMGLDASIGHISPGHDGPLLHIESDLSGVKFIV